MIEKRCDVLIIGAGLCGLATAYFLKESHLNIKILESRGRIGGRISTQYQDRSAPLEMGATWLGNKHVSLTTLLEDLDIKVFPQLIGKTAIYEAISTSPHYLAQLPPNPEPSLRLVGGSSAITNALLDQVGKENVILNEAVQGISEEGHTLRITTTQGTYRADYVISTLPPNLFINRINCNPSLPADLSNVAMNTHTWMGESIKIALTYLEPFWRQDHLSGTIMSNVGPIPEMYDHSDYSDQFYALKGFLAGTFYDIGREARLQMILKQLRKYYGALADNYIAYEEAVWIKEKDTYHPYYEHVLPHQNNGHKVYRKTYLDGKLFIGGSETAKSYPGYMDGAVERAREIANEIIS